MVTIASQMTSLAIIYSTVYSDADQRKHQSSASLAFVRGIHRGPVNSPHKWPVTRKMFPFDDIIMNHVITISAQFSVREDSAYVTFNLAGWENAPVIWDNIFQWAASRWLIGDTEDHQASMRLPINLSFLPKLSVQCEICSRYKNKEIQSTYSLLIVMFSTVFHLLVQIKNYINNVELYLSVLLWNLHLSFFL